MTLINFRTWVYPCIVQSNGSCKRLNYFSRPVRRLHAARQRSTISNVKSNLFSESKNYSKSWRKLAFYSAFFQYMRDLLHHPCEINCLQGAKNFKALKPSLLVHQSAVRKEDRWHIIRRWTRISELEIQDYQARMNTHLLSSPSVLCLNLLKFWTFRVRTQANAFGVVAV